MNKEITVIDLFKRIEKHEDIPKKIKYKDNCYMFKHANYSIDHLYELIGHECIGWLEHKDINLFDEVEILEDNTEEIEELDNWFVDERKEYREFDIQAINLCFSKHRDKINELVKAIKEIRKDLNKC